MEKIDNLDIRLYGAVNDPCSMEDPNKLWDEIKINRDILCESIQVVRSKWDDEDLLKGLCIADFILDYPDQVDEDIYSMLVNTIYSNENIARISLGLDKNNNTYLLKTLMNFKLNLTEDQKHFAVNEAMHMPGTSLYKKKLENSAKKMDNREDGASSFITTEHGNGAFDIRYWILRNPNWTTEEKSKLINDFWIDENEYEKVIDAWEWDIVNDDANYDNKALLDKSLLLSYTMRDLVEIYKNNSIAVRIKEDIDFCKLMHKLRPALWEYYDKPKVNVKS